MLRFSSRNVWKGTALLFKEKHALHPWGGGWGWGAGTHHEGTSVLYGFTAQLSSFGFVNTVGYLERFPPKRCGFLLSLLDLSDLSMHREASLAQGPQPLVGNLGD